MVATEDRLGFAPFTFSETRVTLKVHTPLPRASSEEPFGDTLRSTGELADDLTLLVVRRQ